jgi:2-keto-3-deoxy-L-rhamnonate aldolase RhmA
MVTAAVVLAVVGVCLSQSIDIRDEAKTLRDISRVVYDLPAVLQDRGPFPAAFMVFATPSDVRSPVESLDRYRILREKGVPLNGFFLETEHTALNTDSSRHFVALAEAYGFRVLIRVPSLSVDSVKSWNSLGHSGLIVPLVDSFSTIDAAFKANFYSQGRPIGFEVDTRFLTAGSKQDLALVDSRRILAVMIESFTAAENIHALVDYAAARALKASIDPKRIAFWLGPYDMTNDVRLSNPSWSDEQINKYVSDKTTEITQAVVAAGLTMGGHVPSSESAMDRIQQGWKIFTFDGMFSENLFSDQTVLQRFGPKSPIASLRRRRSYLPKEKERLSKLAQELTDMLQEQ